MTVRAGGRTGLRFRPSGYAPFIQLQLGVMDGITEAGPGPASEPLSVDCGGW